MSLHKLYTMLLLTQAPALRCNHIITQIGRGNNSSAEIYVSRTVEDAGPYNLICKHPYENAPKRLHLFLKGFFVFPYAKLIFSPILTGRVAALADGMRDPV